NLQLEDVNWAEGRIVIRAGKTHRERCLSLSQEVGDAIVSYLQNERPKSDCRKLFLRCRPPYGPIISSSSITAIVKDSIKLAGIEKKNMGAHSLRHSAATQMVSRGVTFKDVADVLGHQC